MSKKIKSGTGLVKAYPDLNEIVKEMGISELSGEAEQFFIEELLYECIFAYDYDLKDPDAPEAFEIGLGYQGEDPIAVTHNDLIIYIAPSKLEAAKEALLKFLAK